MYADVPTTRRGAVAGAARPPGITGQPLRKKADIAGAGAGKDGVGSTMQAAAALKSHAFATGGALETTVDMWTSQVKSVLQACAHISNHLDYSEKRHTQDDTWIAAVLRGRNGLAMPVSKLNEYFT
ncbi:hypothetical protein ACFQWA_21395 [Streptomyces thermogriseus]|uniref:hypothetical protein n=1 Tax=Streptomyces thermogriseus TaxID=75292 RepID=UPI003617A392